MIFVCTTIFDKVLVTGVKDLAHTRSEHSLLKVGKSCYCPYYCVPVGGSVLVPVLLVGDGLQLMLGDGSNSYLVTAPTRTWRRLQLVLGDGSNSYLATLAPTPNPGHVLVVVLAAAGDGVLLSAGGDQEGGSPGSATRAASLTRTGRSSPEVR